MTSLTPVEIPGELNAPSASRRQMGNVSSVPDSVVAGRAAAYAELAKPRVTGLILMVSAAAFRVGSGRELDAGQLAWTLAGVTLLAAGIFALNQYIERALDVRMRRTNSRPLPQGRLRPVEALVAGVIWSLAGTATLAFRVNVLSGILALATFALYLFAYTPMKTRSPHCTMVGAVPGAMPAVLGWVAARGELDTGALVMFALLFCWQFPHFHAIAWLYREDYAAAGVRLWPVVEHDGRTAGRQIAAFSLLLLPVSIMPALLGLSGRVYLSGAVLLWCALLPYALGTTRMPTTCGARRLLLATVLYLPGVFALMALDR